MQIVNILAWIFVIPLAAICAYLSLEILLGMRRVSNHTYSASGSHKVVILVPAHNEANGIGDTVRSLSEVSPGATIHVVADNCTDRTAAVAREAGATVHERFEMDRRGKGFALAFGRECLSANPPDALLVIDADCRLSPGSTELLAGLALDSGAPVQAINLLIAASDRSLMQSLSNFAMLIKNLVRARGMMRLGGGVNLLGTGMAFPWSVFSELPLATSDTVEDLNLGVYLAKRGIRVALVEGALITSSAAATSDTLAQRSRWEHGFLATAWKSAVPLIFSGLIKRSRHRITLGAHLLVPPIALLISILLMAMGLLAYLVVQGAYVWPLFLLSSCFATVLGLIGVAWWRHARNTITLNQLLGAPFYLVWKLPIYVSFLFHRQSEWNRTRRKNE